MKILLLTFACLALSSASAKVVKMTAIKRPTRWLGDDDDDLPSLLEDFLKQLPLDDWKALAQSLKDEGDEDFLSIVNWLKSTDAKNTMDCITGQDDVKDFNQWLRDNSVNIDDILDDLADYLDWDDAGEADKPTKDALNNVAKEFLKLVQVASLVSWVLEEVATSQAMQDLIKELQSDTFKNAVKEGLTCFN